MIKLPKSLAVIGAQWGDEGKGKIVDYLAANADVVARYQGGNNAGHTVVIGDETFKMHHLPVGILYPGVACLLGSGMVVNPAILLQEIEGIQKRGINTDAIRISERCHVILPFHRAMDGALEHLKGDKKIGTTGLGIGPAYADKAYRKGLRMIEFIDPQRFRNYLNESVPVQNRLIKELGGNEAFHVEKLLEEYMPMAEKLAPQVADISLLMEKYLKGDAKILYEGSQGTLLDLDHGTYPYVTSCSTTAGGIASGLGIGPRSVDEIMGVIKAYTTRVGEGPFPTEDLGEDGERMRQVGGEFGTTTGRPRRCGWFDGLVARYASRVNGLTGWGVTKLDVLSGFEKIKVSTGYEKDGKKIDNIPPLLDDLYGVKPIYHNFPGWEEDISGVRKYRDLPAEAKIYLSYLEDITGVRVVLISVGPDREQTIIPIGSYLR